MPRLEGWGLLLVVVLIGIWVPTNIARASPQTIIDGVGFVFMKPFAPEGVAEISAVSFVEDIKINNFAINIEFHGANSNALSLLLSKFIRSCEKKRDFIFFARLKGSGGKSSGGNTCEISFCGLVRQRYEPNPQRNILCWCDASTPQFYESVWRILESPHLGERVWQNISAHRKSGGFANGLNFLISENRPSARRNQSGHRYGYTSKKKSQMPPIMSIAIGLGGLVLGVGLLFVGLVNIDYNWRGIFGAGIFFLGFLFTVGFGAWNLVYWIPIWFVAHN